MKQPLPYVRTDEPFFERHPEWFLYWMVNPTKNAVKATKFWENRKNFDTRTVVYKKRPLKVRLLHWFLTKILRWKFVPAQVFQGSPVFQNVLKDLDRGKRP